MCKLSLTFAMSCMPVGLSTWSGPGKATSHDAIVFGTVVLPGSCYTVSAWPMWLVGLWVLPARPVSCAYEWCVG